MAHLSENLVSIPVDGVELEGDLRLPEDATGLVVFAHGSGSSRKSPRNNYVADVLRARGLGTLLFEAIGHRDTPVIIGGVVIFAYLLAVTVFLLDILYAILDPRVRVGPQ